MYLARHLGAVLLAAYQVTLFAACNADCPQGTVARNGTCAIVRSKADGTGQAEETGVSSAGTSAPGASGVAEASAAASAGRAASTSSMTSNVNGATLSGASGVGASIAGTAPAVAVCSPGSSPAMCGVTGPAAGASSLNSAAGAVATAGSGGAVSTSGTAPIQPEGPCAPGVSSTAETCDGADNDCDGKVDEELTKPCGSMMGVCAQQLGIATCSQGTWGECIGANMPGAEVCDPQELDENCDGQSNEGCACANGMMKPCGSERGLCGTRRGNQTCMDGIWQTQCVGGIQPATEVCDGRQDEDCDGLQDSQDSDCDCINGQTEDCTAGKGICSMGSRTCSAGKWSPCMARMTPRTETCDGVDTDCDGNPDNGAPCPSGLVCKTGQCVCSEGTAMDCTVSGAKGPCAKGRQTCTGGKWGSCSSTFSRMNQDVCGDNEDNDCNGTADDCAQGLTCVANQRACLPKGSYLDSCDPCTYDGSTLTCSCKTKKGSYRSSIPLTCSDPANCSGQLSCMDCYEQIKAQGSFDDSCTCAYNYKSLVCTCKKSDGTEVPAEFWFDDGPCPAGLWNDNGTLRCPR